MKCMWAEPAEAAVTTARRAETGGSAPYLHTPLLFPSSSPPLSLSPLPCGCILALYGCAWIQVGCVSNQSGSKWT